MSIFTLHLRRERGFSIVELAVYIVVLGIISTVISTVVISLFRSEETVSGITSSSNESQIISTVLGNDIRNARAFRVTSNSVTASVAGGGSTVTWQCVRWVVSSGANATLTRQSLPDSGTVPSWGMGATMAEKVQAIGGNAYFSGGSAGAEAGTATAALNYNIGVPSAGNSVSKVAGLVSNRAASAGAKCW